MSQVRRFSTLLILLVVLVSMISPMMASTVSADPWDGETWTVGGEWDGGRVFNDLWILAIYYGIGCFK